MLSHFLRAALLALVGLGFAAPACGQTWQVTQTTGQVWFTAQGAQTVALTRASLVPDGAMVVTGANGRAVLARGIETMVLAPNSAVSLPAPEADSTTVLQRAGEVTFDLERRDVRHFTVETPHLAAVVKGTTFTVRVGELDATVSVERGLVEVTDLFTGEIADVAAGQSAAVEGTFSRLTVGGQGQRADFRQGPPRPALVAALSPTEIVAMQPSVTPLPPARTAAARPAPIAGGTAAAPAAISPPATAPAATGLGTGPTAPAANAPTYLAQAGPSPPRPTSATPPPLAEAFERLIEGDANRPRPPDRPLAAGGNAPGEEAPNRAREAPGAASEGGPGAALSNGLNQLSRAAQRAGGVPPLANQRTRTEEINVPPQMIAAMIAGAVLLALAIAFLRARFG